LRAPGDILLVSCYETGHQPAALASATAFLRRAGYQPACLDLAVEPLDEAARARLGRARLVAVSTPMHTALALGLEVARRVRRENPGAHLCFFGLYAALAERLLLDGGATALADSVLGAEAEAALVALAGALEAGEAAPVAARESARERRPPRLPLVAPDRSALPALDRYARLEIGGERRLAGHVEATRGCKHRCRHCPIPPVYDGRFFAVPLDVVREDARAQIAAGARHIDFGDPDFLNGPKHALAVARALHAEHPDVTFSFTAKVEHLLRHRSLLPELAGLGCLFIVSAFESLSDRVLEILDKGHTAREAHEALLVARAAGISLRPTFVPFTPWSTLEDYLAICRFIRDHRLEEEVDPVQLTIRLLLPPGSLLLEHPEMKPHLGPLDERGLSYRWASIVCSRRWRSWPRRPPAGTNAAARTKSNSPPSPSRASTRSPPGRPACASRAPVCRPASPRRRGSPSRGFAERNRRGASWAPSRAGARAYSGDDRRATGSSGAMVNASCACAARSACSTAAGVPARAKMNPR
jgi:radical SAM superfamily enzyme YgiQ (UPF0313 family)